MFHMEQKMFANKNLFQIEHRMLQKEQKKCVKRSIINIAAIFCKNLPHQYDWFLVTAGPSKHKLLQCDVVL